MLRNAYAAPRSKTVMQTAGMTTMRPADGGVTGRGHCVSLPSARCVGERM